MSFTCRICLEESPRESEFITPCACAGTMRHVHSACLEEWRRHSAGTEWVRRCRECGTPYRLRQLPPARGPAAAWSGVSRSDYVEELHLLSVLAVFCNLGLHLLESSSIMSDAVSVGATYISSVGTHIHTCGGMGDPQRHRRCGGAWMLHGGMLLGCVTLAWSSVVAAISPIPLLNLNWRRLQNHAAIRRRARPPPLNSVVMSIEHGGAEGEGAEAS